MAPPKGGEVAKLLCAVHFGQEVRVDSRSVEARSSDIGVQCDSGSLHGSGAVSAPVEIVEVAPGESNTPCGKVASRISRRQTEASRASLASGSTYAMESPIAPSKLEEGQWSFLSCSPPAPPASAKKVEGSCLACSPPHLPA